MDAGLRRQHTRLGREERIGPVRTDEARQQLPQRLRAHPPAIYRYPLRPEIGADFPYDKVGASAGYPWQAGRMEVPVYEGLPHPLWGLTARITWWLLERYGDILTGML